MSMSTPIYDDLCATMLDPSGVDEQGAAEQGNEGNVTAARNGQGGAANGQADAEQVNTQTGTGH